MDHPLGVSSTTGARPCMSPGRVEWSLVDPPSDVESRQPPRASGQLSAECYEEVLTKLPAGVVLLDRRGRVRKCNPNAEDLLGTAIVGQRWRDVVERVFAPRLDDGHEVSLRDGRRVSISTQALVTEPGQLVLISDVTETRRLQERLNDRARLVSLGGMAAGLAHQIRTPLSTALLYAPNLARGDIGASDRQRFSQKVVDSLQHLERLVRHMLMFARSGAFRCELFDLGEMLEEFRSATADSVRCCDATLFFDKPDFPMLVYGNRDALRTALQNVANNALEACGDDCTLRIRVTADGDSFAMKVTDNGPGIAEELKERIFEPFFTGKERGTGLGLPLVQTILRAHQGTVTVERTDAGGSCFTLRVPRAAGEGLVDGKVDGRSLA